MSDSDIDLDKLLTENCDFNLDNYDLNDEDFENIDLRLGIDGLQHAAPFFVSLRPKSDWALSVRASYDIPETRRTAEIKLGINVLNVGKVFIWPGTTTAEHGDGYYVDPRTHGYFAVECFGNLEVMSSADLLATMGHRIIGTKESEFSDKSCVSHKPSDVHPFDIIAQDCAGESLAKTNCFFLPVVGAIKDRVLPNKKWDSMISFREKWLSLRSNAEYTKTLGIVGMALCVHGGVKKGDALEASGLQYKLASTK